VLVVMLGFLSRSATWSTGAAPASTAGSRSGYAPPWRWRRSPW